MMSNKSNCLRENWDMTNTFMSRVYIPTHTETFENMKCMICMIYKNIKIFIYYIYYIIIDISKIDII